jgi:sodium/hydrogen exchanger-like protein 6/7/sodium/hydrogen exchanger 8
VYSILFGEGLVNDAVSIILFKSVTVVAPTADKLDFKAETFFLLFGNFLYISLCSFLIGVFIGMMHALTLKKLRHISHKAMYEICITIFFGLISYLTGELLELSGIISNFEKLGILTTSILMNHYSIYNMSKIS